MASQEKFLKPLLKLHKHYDQSWGWAFEDLKKALAVFLTANLQFVSTEVHRVTLDAALDVTSYILNFKQHMNK